VVKLVLKIVGGLLLLSILAGTRFYVWASVASSRKLARQFTSHSVDFSIPFPLSEPEVRRGRLTTEAA
jgi:hypothetical protein